MMIDLSKYTFADWMDFVFGHPVNRKSPWYANPLFLYDFDSALVLDYLMTLFADPAFAYLCYTPEQVSQGFDFIVSDRGFIGVLLDEELSRAKRRDCILAMNAVFRWLRPLIFTPSTTFTENLLIQATPLALRG